MVIASGLIMPDGNAFAHESSCTCGLECAPDPIRSRYSTRAARDTGIDRSYVGRPERQSKNPTVELLDRLAESLGVHLSEFFVQPPKERRHSGPCLKATSRCRQVARRNSTAWMTGA
ncbi:helix-turn-helix domain-containing protein [Bradyrhizobium sp. CCGB12]|uniref:helix-turn-helix domain-containing protein n=1 Tax=Bradyrhizobium sp. CCGB12 TaxID=2949632 RepID=UPI0035C0BC30